MELPEDKSGTGLGGIAVHPVDRKKVPERPVGLLRDLNPEVWEEMWHALVTDLPIQNSFLSGVKAAASSAARRLVPSQMVALAIDKILQSPESVEALRGDIRTGLEQTFALVEEELGVADGTIVSANPGDWDRALGNFADQYSLDRLLIAFFENYILESASKGQLISREEFIAWATSERVVFDVLVGVSMEVQKVMGNIYAESVWGAMEKAVMGDCGLDVGRVVDGRFLSALEYSPDGKNITEVFTHILMGNISTLLRTVPMGKKDFVNGFVQLVEDLMTRVKDAAQVVEIVLGPLCDQCGLSGIADEWVGGNRRNNECILGQLANQWWDAATEKALEVEKRMERAGQPASGTATRNGVYFAQSGGRNRSSPSHTWKKPGHRTGR